MLIVQYADAAKHDSSIMLRDVRILGYVLYANRILMLLFWHSSPCSTSCDTIIKYTSLHFLIAFPKIVWNTLCIYFPYDLRLHIMWRLKQCNVLCDHACCWANNRTLSLFLSHCLIVNKGSSYQISDFHWFLCKLYSIFVKMLSQHFYCTVMWIAGVHRCIFKVLCVLINSSVLIKICWTFDPCKIKLVFRPSCG